MSTASVENLRVAILDDDPLFRELVAAFLQSDQTVTLHQSGVYDELLKDLTEERIDCVLLDYDLGGDNGLNVIQKLHEYFVDVPPIIMLTGDGREKTVIKALRMGVADYIAKSDLVANELNAIIRKVVRKRRKEMQARSEHLRLSAASGTDPGTGLINRVQLDERLQQIAQLSPKARSAYGVILVEIVELTDITEKFGLKTADKVILAFAKQLQKPVRSNDIFGRYSHNLFLIIANVLSDAALLDQICRRMSEQLLTRLDLDAASLTFSGRIGASLCDSDTPIGKLDLSRLLDDARAALDKARESGAIYVVADARSVDAAQAPSGRVEAPPGAAEALRSVDRRREPRLRVYRRGQIVIPHLNATIDCIVRDMSKSGARLRVDTPFVIPQEFELAIIGEHSRRSVELRWQKGNDFGVVYV